MTKKKKKDPIQEAITLLQKNGYKITSDRPDPKMGDVVLMKGDEDDRDVILVTMHDTDTSSEYCFGGTIVGDTAYTEPLWIDINEWKEDLKQEKYVLLGHIDLSAYEAFKKKAK